MRVFRAVRYDTGWTRCFRRVLARAGFRGRNRGRARRDRAKEGNDRHSKYGPHMLFSPWPMAVRIAEEVLR